jgi:hypothetical protein
MLTAMNPIRICVIGFHSNDCRHTRAPAGAKPQRGDMFIVTPFARPGQAP